MSTERKKILVFTDWFLPGFKAGGPIRSLANLVARIDHDFYIVTSNRDHHTSIPYEGIKTLQWINHSNNCRVFYIDKGEFNNRLISELIQLHDWNKIYLNSLFSPRFTLVPLRLLRRQKMLTKTILAPRGMLQEGALSIKAPKKKLFLAFANSLGWFKGITWHATSEEEAKAIRLHFPGATRIVVAPNLSAVDSTGSVEIEKKKGMLRLVCIARISPEKGILQAIEFLQSPRFKGIITAEFYGTWQNAEYLRQCRTMSVGIPHVTISFPGEIEPSKIPSAMANAHFFYLPSWGENYGHAIVEAFQAGRPVIVSNRTPWRNLEEFQAGWDLELTANAFEPVLLKALEMDQREYDELSSGARKLGYSISASDDAIRSNLRLFE